MNVRPTLICFFFLSLQDGNSGLAKAQISVFTGTEGEDIRVECSFSRSGSIKFFCKNECKGGDLLIETTNVIAQRSRYRIEYKTRQSEPLVSVSISQLTKSDSGRYRCGLGRSLSAASYVDFEVIVVDALLDGSLSGVKTFYKTPGDNVIVSCFFPVSETRKFFCKEQCEDKDFLVQTSDVSAQRDRYSIRYEGGFDSRGLPSGGSLYVTISQLTRSDSGLYRCGLDRFLFQDPHHEFRIVVTDASNTTEAITTLPVFPSSVPSTSTAPRTETPSPRGVLLYVGLTLVVLVLVSLSVLVLCRRRRSTAKEPPVKTEHNVTETNRVYEDIREDGQRQSPPVEISSVDSTAKYSKPGGAETSDDYSVIYAANFQHTAEDDSSRLTYSEIHFPNQAFGSPNHALSGDADHVIYSVPRVRDSSDAGRHEDDPPIYSAVQ